MQKKLKRHPEIVWRVEKRRQQAVLNALEAGEDVGDSGTVTLIQSGMMHQLNLVGGMIWERCDGARTLGEIVAELAVEFDVDRSELETDVQEFAADLQEKGWLIDG